MRNALRIWVAQAFFSRQTWRLHGANNLGMKQLDAIGSSLHGIYPLPRFLHEQLDCCLEAHIADIEKNVLAELQTRMFKKQPLEWFGSFLTTFILLSALETDTWMVQTWAHDAESMHNSTKEQVRFQVPDSPRSSIARVSGRIARIVMCKLNLGVVR